MEKVVAGRRRLICVDCGLEGRLWRAEFEKYGILVDVILQDQMPDPKSLDELAAEAETDAGCVVLYTGVSMDIRFEAFLLRLRPTAHLLPVGGDAVLLGLSNVPGETIERLNQYLKFGGTDNIRAAGAYLRQVFFSSGEEAPLPEPIPFDGIFTFEDDRIYRTLEDYVAERKPNQDRLVGILVHRHNWVGGDLEPVRQLVCALRDRGIDSVPVFSSGNADARSFRALAADCFQSGNRTVIHLLINFHHFMIRAQEGVSVAEQSIEEFTGLGVPVLAPVQSYYLNKTSWTDSHNPLAADMPMALIGPEMAGMIEPVLIGVRDSEGRSVPVPERIGHFADRVRGWVRLAEKPNAGKQIVLMLHSAVCSGVEATIGKAFGLDAMESVVRILRRLRAEGYSVGRVPESGRALLALFLEKKAYSDFRWTAVEDIAAAGGCLYVMPVSEYKGYYDALPEYARFRMEEVWGPPPGEGMVLDGGLAVTGLRFGNVTVMIQPKRGCYGAKCTGEVCKILHDASCPPPHQYLAVYRYIQHDLSADAVVDIGTEGSCEFLPGKTAGLSENCWPSIIMGGVPNIYLYHAGVMGEGLVAKRRMNAVIVDYLPAAYGGADESARALLTLIDEYQNAARLSNEQEQSLCVKLKEELRAHPAAKKLMEGETDFQKSLAEIRQAIYRSQEAGLTAGRDHIFGECPVKEEAARYLEESGGGGELEDRAGILAGLARTGEEMDRLIDALSGRYIPAGESGMPDENGRNILPTGRNFFGMSIDKIPTQEAWRRGVQLAEQLLSAYSRDEGGLPEKIAMNMISLDVTRSGGEQLCEFLYLLGVRPVWDKMGRVAGLESMNLSELGRPRIDATVRISGVLRDTWPFAVQMMDDAVLLAASLDESPDKNFLKKHIMEFHTEFGEDGETADFSREATTRIFGDAPGTYGAGLDLALMASAWQNEEDLAKYFVQASAFAYGNNLDGRKSIREFIHNAKGIQATADVTQSRRMNALACSFSTQVQGGYRLLARQLSGRKVRQYQAVSEPGATVHTESLEEHLRLLAQDTVLNPFWRHSLTERGTDGASELMHAVQSIFSAQIVLDCFDDGLLDRLAEQTVGDETLREWLAQVNPYALEEMARRMLELESRGKWRPDEAVLNRLRETYLVIEGDMEGRTESRGDIQGGNVEIVTDQSVALWREQLGEIEEALAMTAGEKETS